MTIWLLTILLLASLAALGFRQGAVRVAFSFVGIVLGALLAGPLGKLIKPILTSVGLKNPLLAGPLSVLLGFIIISIIFKVAGFTVHQKVDVYFKYKAGDLRLALYERLVARLGLCMGLFNGAAYMVLISWIIYVLGYWTCQTATSDTDPTILKIVNRLAKDLDTTGFHKVVRSIDPMPQTYYGNPQDKSDGPPGFPRERHFQVRFGADSWPLAVRPEFHDDHDASRQANRLGSRDEPHQTGLRHGDVESDLHRHSAASRLSQKC